MNTPHLSNEQTRTEAEMLDLLARLGREVVGRMVDGRSELYIHCHVRNAGIEVWIYGMGAEIHYKGKRWMFEIQGYHSFDKLREEFLAKLEELCK